MSHSLPAEPAARPALSLILLRGIACLLALAAGIYGLMAIDTGYVNFKGTSNPEVVALRMELRESAGTGVAPGAAAGDVAGHTGVYIAALANLTSPAYAYGAQGLSEPLVHYADMPASGGYALALHNTMGGLLMVFGALQFWPALRRRYPRWHRGFGMVYVVAAVIAMLAAMTYLTLTPIALIYDTFTFYVGLWFLATGVLVSIGLSMWHLRRREIAQHQAYMAISYGFLLTAPVQRYLWLLAGMIDPELRQLEGNFAVTAGLIPGSLLIAYGLFTINRLYQERRTEAQTGRALAAFPRAAALGRAFAWSLLPLLALAIVATLQHFLLSPGLAAYVGDSGLIPAGVIAIDQQVIAADSGGRLAFVIATCTGLGLGIALLWRHATGRQPAGVMAGWVLVACTAVAGVVMSRWGVEIGMPSFATLAGGATWLFGGITCLLLAAMLAWALRARAAGWTGEWSLFAVITLLGAPSFYLLFPLLASAGIPLEYVEGGHLYRLASYGQWFLLLGAFVCGIYGRATQERFAR